ncbi:hypothetical protein Ahy_B08g089846 [Arachis hypogaea]|uniref:Uncharacterized protein n=1 Tax=Arachis hypogaea TaxID=3818 RepID=A0A444XYX9_ARAHY|nr:hypothetical protein Ahy_B08g089846 [Arachis hypogaea]
MQQRGEVEIQNISNSEDKPFSRIKLSSQNLCAHNERRRSLDNFQRCFESFTPLLSRPCRDALTIQGAKHIPAGNPQELSFIEKDVRNYITQEVRNVSEQDDAKEFRKYLLRMKEKN